VLAGYAWDPANPYAGPQSARRLRALAAACRSGDRVDRRLGGPAPGPS
jgi:hypothetical protein